MTKEKDLKDEQIASLESKIEMDRCKVVAMEATLRLNELKLGQLKKKMIMEGSSK